MLDLANPSANGKEGPYEIKDVLTQNAYGIDLNIYVEKGLKLRGSPYSHQKAPTVAA